MVSWYNQIQAENLGAGLQNYFLLSALVLKLNQSLLAVITPCYRRSLRIWQLITKMPGLNHLIAHKKLCVDEEHLYVPNNALWQKWSRVSYSFQP